jgi:hypothetical protein
MDVQLAARVLCVKRVVLRSVCRFVDKAAVYQEFAPRVVAVTSE